jgi:hypothetical protein
MCEAFFTSGFLPYQQSGPQTALARHGELMSRSAMPWFAVFPCSLIIFAGIPMQARCGEPHGHYLVARLLSHTPSFWFLVLYAYLHWGFAVASPKVHFFLFLWSLNPLASKFLHKWLVLDIKSVKQHLSINLKFFLR